MNDPYRPGHRFLRKSRERLRDDLGTQRSPRGVNVRPPGHRLDLSQGLEGGHISPTPGVSFTRSKARTSRSCVSIARKVSASRRRRPGVAGWEVVIDAVAGATQGHKPTDVKCRMYRVDIASQQRWNRLGAGGCSLPTQPM
jgi:hypothetical protein